MVLIQQNLLKNCKCLEGNEVEFKENETSQCKLQGETVTYLGCREGKIGEPVGSCPNVGQRQRYM